MALLHMRTEDDVILGRHETAAAARAKLFWFGCIPARVILAIIAEQYPAPTRLWALYAGSRYVANMETSTRGFFGGRVWWSSMRAGHGFLWLTYAITGDSVILAMDVLFAILNWLLHKT